MSSFWIFLLALFVLAAAAGIWLGGRRPVPRAVALARIQAGGAAGAGRDDAKLTAAAYPQPPILERLRDRLRQAGLNPRSYLWKAGAIGVLVALGLVLWNALLALAFLLFFYPAGLWLDIKRRVGKRRAAAILELPGFLDAVVRVSRIGVSLPAALLAATKDATGPVKEMFSQVMRRQAAGMSLDQALHQVADFYQIKELGLIAAVLRLNIRYGGRTDIVLERIADWLRGRVAAQAEFAALSAETRMGALILSLMIPGLAVYIMIFNYHYILGMWLNPLGKWLLIGGFGLLALGVVLMMRLSKLR
jgi:tight adherence protein B